MESWFILAASLAYLLSLFAIAWYGDRTNPHGSERRTPWLYALSFGVYCTSWTFYGAVGRAATGGFYFLPIYIGPIVMIGLGWPILARIVRVAKSENVVSISDFLSARYGKSRGLAALVTIAAVIGLLPYIALQLKAISVSFEILAGSSIGADVNQMPGGTALLAALLMAAFAILFGVRSVSANEHHRGLMMAIAAESVVKLAAALGVGGVIAFAIFGTPATFFDAAARHPGFLELIRLDSIGADWWVACLLSGLAILCLPRQFHVAVVENTHSGDVRSSARLFPAYLVAINLFVLPVALAGLLLFPDGTTNADTFMVSIPLTQGWPWLALAAFIGGLSAATSMILVEMVALSTMICNDIAVPLLMALRPGDRRLRDDPAGILLLVRRSAVIVLVLLSYGCYRLIGPAFPLATIGMMSFTAVAQFAPALLGGLVWSRASRSGAFAGICAGFIGWAYTMLLPSFADAGWLAPSALREGPFGLTGLSPIALAGIAGIDPLTNAALWSLGPNLLLFVLVSLLTRPSTLERQQAARFMSLRHASDGEPHGPRGATLADLHDLAVRYVGQPRADAAFRRFTGVEDGDLQTALLIRTDGEAIQLTERLLAGAVGSASARVVVAGLLSDRRLSRTDARSIIDEASRAILKQHELLRATIENVPQGIAVFDEDWRVATWNNQFLVLLELPDGFVQVGTSLEEIVGLIDRRGEYGRNGEIETLLARRSDPRRRNRPDVYERVRPDGTVLEIATNPMPGPKPGGGGFVAVYTDVTERHRAAAALREANESLERRIGERTRALSEAKAEAERANRGKTRFLAAASHDLLQPLHAARLFLSALSERNGDTAIRQIDASLRSVEQILGDLLDVSKIDSGVVKPNPVPMRIDELLKPLGEEFTVLASRHGLGLRVVECSATVRSDPTLLRRILQNYLANAVRYTRTGRILLGCRRRGAFLSIEVWDTGPGIPEHKVPEIFMEFRQLDNEIDERGKGLGLGLAIVERLAGILGHTVQVRSKVGRGSAFSVLVPLTDEPVAARAVVARPRGRDLRGVLVLCLENEPAIARATEDLLSSWSCRVVTAVAPDLALAKLDGRTPDVILTDYHLDRSLTGVEALRTLRATLGSDIPAAVVTADRDISVREDIEAAGCRLLYKPVRPGALRALLGQLLAEGQRMAG
ncbi:hybrid sensor histidine kinase/response regulator [Azospirillum picis]|uniref:histidine kinase n=1 Tax=Azospirillum picis TaxID=488438 RepID=A0ABU0MV49_9PROT|nr:PAS domain-containing hybrid sensor histidine kinase/response regulator [Azospirillum picis]MBP2303358.1 PAS domain S-box-containing protein [Azospirillum picis]MDQ0537199.1 PAS domain S-box-containing protein [Azospirillum picis]